MLTLLKESTKNKLDISIVTIAIIILTSSGITTIIDILNK